MEKIFKEKFNIDSFEPLQASEDFVFVSTQVPMNDFFIGTATIDSINRYEEYNPCGIFNKEFLNEHKSSFNEETFNREIDIKGGLLCVISFLSLAVTVIT